jgi:polar amino acid transport system permease protein
MAEIIRAGIMSVDGGQIEAARSLGMHHRLLLRRVVLPQAMRVVIPPTGNQLITMLKTTSLCSVIAIAELLYSVELIYQRNFETIPLLIVASLWYLLMTTVASIGQYYLERHFGRGQTTMLSLNLQHRR